MLVDRCLCCSLKAGIIIALLFELIFNVILFAICLVSYIEYENIKNNKHSIGILTEVNILRDTEYIESIMVSLITLIVLHNGINLLKIIAICTDVKYWLIPWIIFYPFAGLGVFINFGVAVNWLPWRCLIMCLFAFVLLSFNWCCTFSYYVEMSRYSF